jgi:L-malate glycosyltransferase
MNILILCHEYPPIGGGGGIGAMQYAEAWAGKGHNVTVLTGWLKGLSFQERVNTVEVVRIFTPGSKLRSTVSFTAMAFFLLFGLAYVLLHIGKLKRYQIINTHFSIPGGILGVIVSKILGIPNLLTIIGGDIYDPSKNSSPHKHLITRVINRFVIGSSNCVVAISNDTKKRAEKYYGIRKEIQVINYGFIPVEINKKTPLNNKQKSDNFILISVGRLIPRKGFEYLIHSLELLPSDIHLILVGDGPCEPELKHLAKLCNVENRISFVGYKPRLEIFNYLDKADCYVLPSLHEGLGIVVQEAMYMGLPVVCTNNGGQTDLIREPRNGILVEPGNAKMLADAIYKYYSNRELSKEVGYNNKLDIKEHYISYNSEYYLAIFEGLINQGAMINTNSKISTTGSERLK